MTKRKSMKLTKALGLKNEQPENLKGLAAAGAGKETRFKPGDERLKNNQGSRLQIVPPAVVKRQRKKFAELVQEFADSAVSNSFAEQMGIKRGGTVTLYEACVAGLFAAASMRGDLSALKTITEMVEEVQPSGQPFNRDFPLAKFPAPALHFFTVSRCPHCHEWIHRKDVPEQNIVEKKEATNENPQTSDQTSSNSR